MPQFDTAPLESIIGKGITLPLVLVNGRPLLTSGFPLIRSSLKIIISWAFGSRFFLNEFGSKINQLLEEPNDDVLKTLIETFVIDAITTWEKRVEVTGMSIGRPTNQGVGEYFEVVVNYRVIATEREDTFVFPFYKQIVY